MKFYIFSSDQDSFTASVRNAVYSSTDYFDICDVYDRMNMEYAYCNSYLIADFEYKHSSLFGYDSYENIKDHIIVPFLIINEFHYNKSTFECNAINSFGKFDSKLTERKDSIIIETAGFAEEYTNNVSALGRFMYYIDNKVPANMSLIFTENKAAHGDPRHKPVIAEYKRKIAFTIDCLRGRKESLKKIKLDKNIKLQRYEFPKHTFYDFTFIKEKEEEPA